MSPDTPARALLESLVGQRGSRQRIPTPALVLDADALERNIAKMAARAAAAGLGLRPHAKSHKCAAIARAQMAAGALGVCCAKLGEAEALAGAGIDSLLLSSPVVGADNAARVARLAGRMRDLALVVDHPLQVAALARACAEQRVALRLLVDVDVGLARTGVASVDDALSLAAQIASEPALALIGVQGYGGHWQHLRGAARRQAAVAEGMRRLAHTTHALREAGHTIGIVTGGGTGSFAADAALGILTEVQPGSYLFMDQQYRDALGEDPDGAFEQSLFVAASVVSINAPAHVTLDAGLKAFATDGPLPRPRGERFGGCRYFFFGDEHGGLERPGDGATILPGERIELIVPHCDPTVDRYDCYVRVRGDTIEALMPIEAARQAQ